jgi:hypothetical protein
MKMEEMSKLLLKFDKSFWFKDIHGMICADCFMPEFWVNSSNGVGTLIDPEFW